MNYPPITNTFQKLTFGKYKGHTVRWLMDLHPDYLLWLSNNAICKVISKIYKKAEQAAFDQTDHYGHVPHNYRSYYGDDENFLQYDVPY